MVIILVDTGFSNDHAPEARRHGYKKCLNVPTALK